MLNHKALQDLCTQAGQNCTTPYTAACAIAARVEKSEEHNGWPNIETWTVNLWLTNDQDMFTEVQAAIEFTEGNATEEAIEAFCETMLNMDDGAHLGFVQDMLNRALARVDWRAIAESLRAD